MKRITSLFVVASAVALLPACQSTETANKTIGEYASSLIADTTQATYQIISSSREKNNHGSIAIIGEPGNALLLSEYMIQCDRFDNINGKNNPDGLPDFAGETISPILDSYNGSYADIIKKGKEGYLSEINIRNFAAALDTACYLNSYDTDKIVHKSGAKLVVLSSSYSSAFGYDDIDTLRTLTNSKTHVISPVHAMLDEAWSLCGEGMNIGIWTTSDVPGSDIYASVFEKERELRSDFNAKYTVISPDTSSTITCRFLDFMKKYIDSSDGNNPKLQAILIDDLSVDIDELEDAVKSVLAVEQDSYITYLNFLDSNLKLIDFRGSVSSACYKYLRQNNAFTHKISYPAVNIYVTAASERDSSYVTLELKDKYLTEEIRNLMIVSTPKIFSEYVR